MQHDRRQQAGAEQGQGQLIGQLEMLGVDQGDQQQLPPQYGRHHRGREISGMKPGPSPD
ncbi:hypothetical protein D3C87_1421930 [compost metagenome]